MKFISWNLQGHTNTDKRYKYLETLLKIFEDHEADVVFIQEPTGSLKDEGNRDDHIVRFNARTSRLKKFWRAWTYPGASPQGTIVILTCGSAYVSEGKGVLLNGQFQGSPQGASRPNPLVCGMVKAGPEAGAKCVTFATCHAPFDGGIDAASNYSIAAMKAIHDDNRTLIGGQKIQLWMGDLNTLGDNVPGGSSSNELGRTYRSLPVGPTTLGQGNASGERSASNARDKIIVRKDRVTTYCCGRIIPKTKVDPRDKTSTDEKEETWDNPNVGEVPSDHLPIYIRLGHAPSSPAPAGPSAGPSAEREPRKRKDDHVNEILEAIGINKPSKKQKAG
jgi:hypothetical protein